MTYDFPLQYVNFSASVMKEFLLKTDSQLQKINRNSIPSFLAKIILIK
jgi:hypothetical protein